MANMKVRFIPPTITSIPSAWPDGAFMASYDRGTCEVKFDWPAIEAAASDLEAFNHGMAAILLAARLTPKDTP